jgi:hypothetical protein
MNEQHTGEGGNMDEDEGTAIVHRVAEAWLDENDLVPLALIAIELGEPVELVADRLRDVVRLDDVGMRVVPAAAARQFFFARAEQEARMADQARRIEQGLEPSPIPIGVPAQEGSTPLESLMAGDRSYVSPQEEFGRIPKPNFVAEEIEAGERRLAAAQAEAESKKAARQEKA